VDANGVKFCRLMLADSAKERNCIKIASFVCLSARKMAMINLLCINNLFRKHNCFLDLWWIQPYKRSHAEFL